MGRNAEETKLEEDCLARTSLSNKELIKEFLKTCEEEEKRSRYFYPLIYFIVWTGFISTIIYTSFNIKNSKGWLFFIGFIILGYILEQIIFCSIHVVTHAEFLEQDKLGYTGLAHYHHFKDASIFAQYPSYTRYSYYKYPWPIILLFFFTTNYITFWSYLIFFLYEMLVHESYHVRDPDSHYKTKGIREFLTKPNEFEKKLIDWGRDLKFHDRERHRDHHLLTFDEEEDWNEWDDLFIFGKYESLVKNTLSNAIYNSIKDKENSFTLAWIQLVIVVILCGIGTYLLSQKFNPKYMNDYINWPKFKLI